MGVYVPRRTLLSAWGVGSRTRFWWFRLILGIYNLQGLDVAGLLSGPQPSSSTLPNLSCPHWLCVPPVSLDAAPLTWLDLCHAHRGQSSTSPGTVHAGSPVLLCLLPALYVVAVARAPSS